MFFQNDKTAPCSGQPWKSCGRMGITPGLPPAKLLAAHPRGTGAATAAATAAPAAQGPWPRRPFHLPLPGRLAGRGATVFPSARWSAPPPPAAPRRSLGEELKKGKALLRVPPPAGEGIPSARARTRPPAPAPSCSEKIGFCRRVGGKGSLNSSHRHLPLPSRIPEKRG